VAAATGLSVLYHGGKKLGVVYKQNMIKVTYEICMFIIRIRKICPKRWTGEKIF
jgi:hypothetical protein